MAQFFVYFRTILSPFDNHNIYIHMFPHVKIDSQKFFINQLFNWRPSSVSKMIFLSKKFKETRNLSFIHSFPLKCNKCNEITEPSSSSSLALALQLQLSSSKSLALQLQLSSSLALQLSSSLALQLQLSSSSSLALALQLQLQLSSSSSLALALQFQLFSSSSLALVIQLQLSSSSSLVLALQLLILKRAQIRVKNLKKIVTKVPYLKKKKQKQSIFAT